MGINPRITCKRPVFRWAGHLVSGDAGKISDDRTPAVLSAGTRYGIPTLFVMNKCEETAVLEDYARVLGMRVLVSGTRNRRRKK